MYDSTTSDEQVLISKAVDVLSSSDFYKACLDVIDQWPVATLVNLTNLSANRRAWLGQACCCYVHGVPEITTRKAWAQLTNMQRMLANDAADRAIRTFEATHRRLYHDVGEPLLF
jgi:hypothetical protein